MKKILVLFIALQLLSGNTLLPELAKIPALITHFKEHKKEIEGLTFFHFLQMHYADSEHQQTDQQRHGSLPLKASHVAHAEVFNFPTNLTSPSVFETLLPQNIEQNCLILYQNPYLDSHYGLSVFQPPRV
jgi:hypothetical protein